jgi:hypothetical protein
LKLKAALLGLGAFVLAATTVSAALLVVVPTPKGPVTTATTWTDLPVVSVAFPDNLNIKLEQVYVLKTQAQWNAFWQSVPGVTVEGKAIGDLPAPDFSHQFAVVASYGWKSEGYAIQVTHAKTNGMQVAVQVDRQVPNPSNCRVYFDPFFGGIAIVEQPHTAHFDATPVGSSYNQVMEPRWASATRDCRTTSA